MTATLSMMQDALLATPLHRQMALELRPSDTGIVIRGVLGADFARADGLHMAHGGAISAVLDTATVWAAVATTGQLWATVDLRVDYLRPVPLGDIVVNATVVHQGSSVARTRAELCDSGGKLLAVGTATLAAQPSPDGR